MLFDEEPEWMRKARQAPLVSSWESRQPPTHDTAKNPIEALTRTIA